MTPPLIDEACFVDFQRKELGELCQEMDHL